MPLEFLLHSVTMDGFSAAILASPGLHPYMMHMDADACGMPTSFFVWWEPRRCPTPPSHPPKRGCLFCGHESQLSPIPSPGRFLQTGSGSTWGGDYWDPIGESVLQSGLCTSGLGLNVRVWGQWGCGLSGMWEVDSRSLEARLTGVPCVLWVSGCPAESHRWLACRTGSQDR